MEIAGILLGVVVLGSLAGFHTGPHTHAVAGVAGILSAAWLTFMVVTGHAAPLLWGLLGVDVAVSLALGFGAWQALSTDTATMPRYNSLESEDGIATTDLVPDGVVRIRGELWSAQSMNGTVPAGTRVQVLRDSGVRLEVWSEDAADPIGRDLFTLD